jgi:uncharacterized Rmd1/YagE family protein
MMKRGTFERVSSAGDLETDGRYNLDKSTKRTTKITQKLALFPSKAPDEQVEIDEFPRNKRRIETEQMLATLDKSALPRATGYCIANGIDMHALMNWLIQVKGQYRTAPKRFDEAIYTTFTNIFSPIETETVQTPMSETTPLINEAIEHEDRLGRVDAEDPESQLREEEDASPYARLGGGIGQIFFFDYGAVVFFGLNEREERFVLRQLNQFLEEPLKPADVETEVFRFTYNSSYQPRIWNDIILVRNPSNYMLLLTIAHAIGQSTKLALFEELVEATINRTRGVPEGMAITGTVGLSSSQITRLVGQLFMLRINVNLVSNVVDIPELFWSEPALEPFYRSVRQYLEIQQRVDLLNQRVGVLSDLLSMLKDHLESRSSENLEIIVIALICFEIIIGVATIIFDSMAD